LIYLLNNKMGNQYSLNTDITKIKPVDLFNLTSDFTWDELKEAYKKIALKTHPDKGGNKQIFEYCTKCFKELAMEYKMRHSNKSHNELKKNFKEDVFTQLKPKVGGDDFTKEFNSMFEQNKFYDDEIEFGYGDKMAKSTKNRKDYDIQNIFDTENVTNEKFNQTFNKKIKPRNDIIKYQEPQPLHLTKSIQFSELGSKTTDYTGTTDNNRLAYTDYLKAHSEERIPTKSVRKEFKNTKEYQLYSDKYKNQAFSTEEIRKQEKAKAYHERMEQNRLIRLKDKDEQIGQYYDKVSRLLVK
tara:strand:+ start:5073 stop:5966 length:894 start_codon:yes stop_codon:yes gene_type:complete